MAGSRGNTLDRDQDHGKLVFGKAELAMLSGTTAAYHCNCKMFWILDDDS
jgi:hypothetical protein